MNSFYLWAVLLFDALVLLCCADFTRAEDAVSVPFEFYLSLQVPELEEIPSEPTRQMLENNLEAFLHSILCDEYGDYFCSLLKGKDEGEEEESQLSQATTYRYMGVDVTEESMLYDAGIPEEDFNLYCIYDCWADFSINVGDSRQYELTDLPTQDEIENVVYAADWNSFVQNHVRYMPGLESATEATSGPAPTVCPCRWFQFLCRWWNGCLFGFRG